MILVTLKEHKIALTVPFHKTKILDSSSDTSPSAPSLQSNSESQTTTTTHTRKVTPATPSKSPLSQTTDTCSISSTSISHTNRPPISEILFTTRSQPSPTHTFVVILPNPDTGERYVN